MHLHPKQKEFVDTRSRVKTACCGRRWGKSYGEAVGLIWFAIAHPGTTQFLFAPTADQSRIIFRYVVSMLERSPVPDLATRVIHSPYPEVQFLNGSVVHARSTGDSGANVRGHGADRCVLDEAAFMPSTVIAEVIPPMLAQSPHAELELISTPFGRSNHFFEYWTRGDAGDPGYASFRYPSSTNPYLSPSYLDQQRRDMTSLAFRVEYEAEFAEDQNSVFPWTLIQSCLADCASEPQPGHRYVIGWDPAQYNDRSGVCVLDVTTKPWRVVSITDISGRDYPVQEAEIKRLCGQYAGAPVLLDATSHAPVLQHLSDAGVSATGFTFTSTSKRELIDGLVLAMEQGELVFPSEPALVDELKYYRYTLTKSGNVKLGADERHHDDLVTAMALAVQAQNTGGAHPYAYMRDDPAVQAILGRLQ